VGPCLLLGLLLHPNLNQNFLTDSAWTFALYLESVAILPQLLMFQVRVRHRLRRVAPRRVPARSGVAFAALACARSLCTSLPHTLRAHSLDCTQRLRDPEVEPFTANYVFALAVGRVLSFVFWVSSFHELNDKYASSMMSKYPGLMVVGCQIVNLLLMADYMYLYLTSARAGRPLLLPHTI